MQNIISRRALIKGGLIAGALVPAMGLIGNTAGAAALTPLDPNDPMAKAVKYAPTYKPTQKCANCAQYVGKASDASAGCNVFAGKSVPAGGWCNVWAQKPGA
jgi:hypothetical protein